MQIQTKPWRLIASIVFISVTCFVSLAHNLRSGYSLSSASGPAATAGFTISGLITQGSVPGSGTPIAAVSVQLSYGSPATVTTTSTDNNGNFSLANVPSGVNFDVTPSKAGWVFQPVSQGGVLSSDRMLFFTGSVSTPTPTPTPTPLTVQFSAANFVAGEGDGRVNITVTRSGDTSAAASVSFGTIDDAGLQPCSQVNGTASPRCDFIYSLGTLTWAAGDASAKSFSVAIVDDSYAEGSEAFRVALTSPSGAALGSPAIATVTINDNETVNGPNPIDGTNFFVRQQYIDFLGREPDPAGFAGWTSTINNCSGDTTQCDRIHVSQLFFQSNEFQSRGYYVFKFYPVSFPGVPGVDPAGAGHKPDYAQFAPDLAAVSGFLTDAQLDAAKDQFAIDFTNRAAFMARYPTSMTPTQYVDTLLQTAGVSGNFNPTTRQNLINGLTGGTLTRAQVLRQIVDSPEVSSKYFNEAYVVMEYFGYLRRDPDALYLSWLNVINQSNDPRGMVTGFATSNEYRQRFGP